MITPIFPRDESGIQKNDRKQTRKDGGVNMICIEPLPPPFPLPHFHFHFSSFFSGLDPLFVLLNVMYSTLALGGSDGWFKEKASKFFKKYKYK